MTKKLILVVMFFLFFSSFAFYSFASQKEIQHYNIRDLYEKQKILLSRKNSLPKIDLDTLKMETSKKPKIGPVLNNFLARKKGASVTMTGPDRDSIRLILNTAGNYSSLYNAISRNNAKILHKGNGSIALEVPVDNIESLVDATEAVKNVRLPVKFYPMEVTTEGVELTNASSFHNADYTGAGVRIAIMDVGFKGLTDAYRNGDIPYGARTYDFTGKGIETEYYHGTACAEIIHDIAPDAELYLLKISDEIDIYNAIDFCIENNIDIISMSIGTFGTGPGDGTGPLDEYFDRARDNGILVVASAGNYANMEVDYDADGNVDFTFGGHWEGEFYDPDNDGVHEFTGSHPESTYNVIGAYPSQDDDGNPDTSEVSVLLRWNDWINCNIDYDLYLYEYDLIYDSIGDLVSYSNITQDGSQPPMEYISIDLADDEDTQYYALVVQKKTGEPAGTEIEIYLGGTSTFLPFRGSFSAVATSESSINEPADAESVLAVGAIYYEDWEYGPQESFSSQGPTNAWAGSTARIKPDISGPDGISTYIRGAGSFFGTSAVTPHIAGAAALILSSFPNYGPDELQTYLEANAIDMGDKEKDNLYGSGRLNTGHPLFKFYQKISDTEGNFTGGLLQWDNFGGSVASIGDLDGDGITDLAVGANGHSGAVWILFLNPDGTVKSHQKISDTEGNFTGYLDSADHFGESVASIGDLDGDGITDLAVGSTGDDDGGDWSGAVWILFLDPDGTVKSHQKISSTEGNFKGELDEYDWFGQSVASIGDLDGDGITDLAVGARGDDDSGTVSGAIWILFLYSNGTVKSYQKISGTEGNFTGDLGDYSNFGQSVASIGDLDGDGITDLAVGAVGDNDGGDWIGAVWVLFLNSDGTVKSHQKISTTEGNFTGDLHVADAFGTSLTSIGDLDKDNVIDLVVGAHGDDDGGNSLGAVWILFLNSDGTVKSYQKISAIEGNFSDGLDNCTDFGISLASINDLDGDDIVDVVVGSDDYISDDNLYNYGAVWILFLNHSTSDKEKDGLPDNWENIYQLDPSSNDSGQDPDNDGYTNLVEYLSKTDPFDADTDDDGISDGDEDFNVNSSLDDGETFPTRMDSDGDAVQDGTELGLTSGISGTDSEIFVPDSDPFTTTDPLNADTDGDGLKDGDEDSNRNGRVDSGETDPNVYDITNDDIDDNNDISDNDSGTSVSGSGHGGGCFIATAGYDSRIEPHADMPGNPKLLACMGLVLPFFIVKAIFIFSIFVCIFICFISLKLFKILFFTPTKDTRIVIFRP